MTDNHKEYKETDSFATVLKGNVIIDCVKPAEDDDKIIIRLYEPYGTRGVVKVKFINGNVSYISYTYTSTSNPEKVYYEVINVTDYNETVVDLPSMIGPA